MTEEHAISIIETELKKTISSVKIDIIKRNFTECSEYIAVIVAIFKDDAVLQQTFTDLRDRFMSDGITEISIIGTVKDLQDLDFEILTLEAQITIGE